MFAQDAAFYRQARLDETDETGDPEALPRLKQLGASTGTISPAPR